MKLELRQKEINLIKWALIHWHEKLEREQRATISNEMWETIEEDIILCKILIKNLEK